MRISFIIGTIPPLFLEAEAIIETDDNFEIVEDLKIDEVEEERIALEAEVKKQDIKRIKAAKKELTKKDLKKDAIKKTFKKLEEASDELILTLKIKASDELNQNKIDSKKDKVQDTKEEAQELIAEAKAKEDQLQSEATMATLNKVHPSTLCLSVCLSLCFAYTLF